MSHPPENSIQRRKRTKMLAKRVILMLLGCLFNCCSSRQQAAKVLGPARGTPGPGSFESLGICRDLEVQATVAKLCGPQFWFPWFCP